MNWLYFWLFLFCWILFERLLIALGKIEHQLKALRELEAIRYFLGSIYSERKSDPRIQNPRFSRFI